MIRIPRLALLAVAALLVFAPAAGAHVTVSPSELTAGSFAKLTFRVPNERDDASTVKVEIALPDEAFEHVSIQPVEGWDYQIDRAGDVVTQITWSGGSIAPGEFQEFSVSAGPVPDADVLEFPAIQTYSSGEVVRWIDSLADSATEPDHPVPTATIVGGDDGEHEEPAINEATAGGDDRNGRDGTDPAAFVALLVAGIATVGAVAALIFGPRRVPA